MDYGFDEDQEAYAREIRRFATKVLAPHYQSDDAAATFRTELSRELAQVGLTGLRIPEEYGGQDATAGRVRGEVDLNEDLGDASGPRNRVQE